MTEEEDFTRQIDDSFNISGTKYICIFSAPTHTPTDDEIINNTKMPTARTALEGKAMKTIAEIYFLYPNNPDIPLVQINALNDIKN